MKTIFKYLILKHELEVAKFDVEYITNDWMTYYPNETKKPKEVLDAENLVFSLNQQLTEVVEEMKELVNDSSSSGQ